MPPDRIEREIDIDAPIDVVWTVVTDPQHIAQWFADAAEIDVRPGADGRFGWIQQARGREHWVNVRVERLEPPSLFSFRWNHPDGVEPDETNSALVEFTFEPRGDGTRLTLVESGLDTVAWPSEEKETYFGEHTSGWAVIVERLVRYAPTERRAGR